MNKLTMLLVLVFYGAAFCADWETQNVTEEGTGLVSTAAYITSSEGHSLGITKRPNGAVWGFVQLAGDNQFGAQGDISVQFDSNTPVEFNDKLTKASEEFGLSMYTWEWNPQFIAFLMWHGEIDKGCGLMGPLYYAKTISVRYHSSESTTKDIAFVVSGNQSAISSAIGIDISPCPSSLPNSPKASATPAAGTESNPARVQENGAAPSTTNDGDGNLKPIEKTPLPQDSEIPPYESRHRFKPAYLIGGAAAAGLVVGGIFIAKHFANTNKNKDDSSYGNIEITIP